MTPAGRSPAPDVTVSIVNASQRDAVLALLASLAATADGDPTTEIVVLDNASDDGSVEAIAETFPWVTLIPQPFRAGFGANHNRVIREARGRYLFVLSHDAVVQPGSLARLVRYSDAHSRVAVAAPRIRYPDGRAQASAWRFPSPAVAALGTLSLGRVGIVQSRGEQPRRVDWAMGAALLLRRSAVEEVGLFDEGFFMYSEETDLCRRLARAGWETHYVPDATVVHADSALRATATYERINEEWRSRHRYWRKHHSRAGARVAAASLAVQYGARAAIASLVLRDAKRAAGLRYHARCARRGVHDGGPGLRELADAWNRAHAAEPARAAR